MKDTLINLLPYIQVILSVLLIVTILLQHSEAGVGSTFGGNDNFGSAFHTRRGGEKFLFVLAVVLAVLFAATSLGALLLK